MPEREDTEAVTTGRAEPRPLAVVEPVTCILCGCLCDDIAVRLDGERVAGVGNGGQSFREWFVRDRARPATDAAARIDGAPASVEEGITRAAELLATAKAPIVLG